MSMHMFIFIANFIPNLIYLRKHNYKNHKQKTHCVWLNQSVDETETSINLIKKIVLKKGKNF